MYQHRSISMKPGRQARIGMRKSRAFTLIEMIGVLVIVAILATVVISTTPRQIDIAAGNLESTNLINYASVLQNSILRNRYIPGITGTSNVVKMIATELGMDPNDVSTNSRGNARAFFFDPQFAFYTNSPPVASLSPATTNGPWWQNVGGAYGLPSGINTYGAGSNNPPANVRIMMVSSLGPALPSA